MKQMLTILLFLTLTTACTQGGESSETGGEKLEESKVMTVDEQSITYDPQLVRDGEELFRATCSACHGSDARGVSGLGKDLVNNNFIISHNDPALHDFIVQGRPAWDEANTTGIDMPPKGGNPSLTNQQIDTIIAYLRSLQ